MIPNHKSAPHQVEIQQGCIPLWLPIKEPPVRNRGIRASNKKTRTGCRTCRTRRVKCDESKPNCKRCLTYGTSCGGYHSTGNTAFPRQTTATQVILPKAHSTIPRLCEISPLSGISSQRFQSEEESRYFRIYCEEMAACITGPFTSSLWESLLPQASEMEPFVRHAVVALGALTYSSKKTQNSLQKYASPVSQASDSTFALKQYDKSLRGMRRAITHWDHDVRKAVIASLLVFCFESLQGNLGSAVSYAESGLMLFFLCFSKYKPSPTRYPPLEILGKPMVDGDLMHAYAGLDLYVMYFKDTRPEWVHRKIITHLNTHILLMPSTIKDAREAREYSFLVTRRNHHFMKIVKLQAETYHLEDQENSWKASHEGIECMMTWPGTPSESIKIEYYEYADDIQRWADATSVLFDSFRERGTAGEKLLTNILCMHAKVTNIVLKGALFSSELEYDAFIPDFRKMLSLAQVVHPQLLAAAERSAGFHYGYGVNYPLFFVCIRCRDYNVRDEAIKLLGSRDHREGTWDAKSLAAIAGWVRDAESTSSEPNRFISEDQRMFLTTCSIDLRARKAFVRAGQRKQDCLVFREHWIKW